MQLWKSGRSLAAASFAALTLAALAAPSNSQSYAGTTIGVGTGANGPRAIASGDVNNDGNRDFVTGNYTTDNFSVFLGNGSGGFTTTVFPFATPLGTQNGDIALVDVNGDRKLDLITSTFYTFGVAILLGDGAGNFGPATQVALPSETKSVLVEDFTGDTVNDILAVSYANDEFHLLQGLGGGVFGYLATIGFPSPFGTRLGSIAAGDFNNDNILDFVSGTFYSGGFGIVLGTGGGTFGPPTLYLGGTATETIAAGDLNNDGNTDVVVLDTAAGTMSADPWIGDGAGGFTAGPSLATGTLPFALEVADTTRDGNQDIVVAENGLDVLSIRTGDGLGGFSAPVTFPIGSDAEYITAGDFDSNGHFDVISANNGTGNITVLMSTTPTPAGHALYGTGTSGCNGLLAMNANLPATINSPTFAFTCTNAPENSLGLLLIANQPDVAGTDLFAFGFLLHVDPINSTFFDFGNFFSDGHGNGFAPFPVPNNPGLIGVTVYSQGLWVEPINETCSPSFLGVVTTKGMSTTF